MAPQTGCFLASYIVMTFLVMAPQAERFLASHVVMACVVVAPQAKRFLPSHVVMALYSYGTAGPAFPSEPFGYGSL